MRLIFYVRRLEGLRKGKEFRVVAFSDTHGSFRAMNRIFKKNGNADLFIFLGDGEKELEQIKKLYPQKNIISVAGNCDLDPDIPDSLVYTVPDGRKIFCTHGHEYGIYTSFDKVCYAAQEHGAEVILFGHTHERYYSYSDGLYIINPGSAASPRDGLAPSYAFLDFTETGILCSHVEVR